MGIKETPVREKFYRELFSERGSEDNHGNFHLLEFFIAGFHYTLLRGVWWSGSIIRNTIFRYIILIKFL